MLLCGGFDGCFLLGGWGGCVVAKTWFFIFSAPILYDNKASISRFTQFSHLVWLEQFFSPLFFSFFFVSFCRTCIIK